MITIILVYCSFMYTYQGQCVIRDTWVILFLFIFHFLVPWLWNYPFKLQFCVVYGPQILCWTSGIVSFTMWLISSWEENKYCYKLSKCTKWHLFDSKWSKLWFWVKIVDILSVTQLVYTFVFFSAWDKSHVKWDKSPNSTQKMRS